MKKEQILQIFTPEPPLVTLADAGKCLAKLVTEVYIVSGVHRTLTKEAFAEEITFATDYLLNAIRSEPRYRQLRSSELRLCISEGLKGRLCDDARKSSNCPICKCVFVLICKYTNALMCVCVYVLMYLCSYALMCLCAYMLMSEYINLSMFKYVCVQMC